MAADGERCNGRAASRRVATWGVVGSRGDREPLAGCPLRGARLYEVLLAGALLVGPTGLTAQEPSRVPTNEATDSGAGGDEEERAMRLFRAGQALYEAGEFVRAAEAFEEAYRIASRPLLLFNAYVAWRDGGRFERAASALRAYLETTPSNEAGRGALERRLSRLEARIAEIEAERKARQALEASRREAAARRERAFRARRLREATAARSRTPWYVAAAGGGLVLLGLGAGGIAFSARSDLEANCGGPGCPYRVLYSDYGDDLARARTWSTVADVTMAVGVAVALGGVLWAVLRPAPRRGMSVQGTPRPAAGPGRAGLRWESVR